MNNALLILKLEIEDHKTCIWYGWNEKIIAILSHPIWGDFIFQFIPTYPASATVAIATPLCLTLDIWN